MKINILLSPSLSFKSQGCSCRHLSLSISTRHSYHTIMGQGPSQPKPGTKFRVIGAGM